MHNPGACCIKCYVWKRSQYCYEFYVSVPWKRNILQKLGYECKRNILYNRPLSMNNVIHACLHQILTLVHDY